MATNVPLDSLHNVRTTLTPRQYATILAERIKAEEVDKIEDPRKKGFAIATISLQIQIEHIDGPEEAVKFYKTRLDAQLDAKLKEIKRELSRAEFERWRKAYEAGEISLGA